MRIYWLVIFIALGGCDQLNESDDTVAITNQISKDEDCKITFTDDMSSKSHNLYLKFGCRRKNEFFPGKLLLEAFQRLSEKKIKRDKYSISDSRTKYYDISYGNLKKIESQLKVFEKHFNLLLDNDDVLFSQNLHPELKNNVISQPWYELMFKDLQKSRKPWKFSGFYLKDDPLGKFVFFGEEIENEVIIYCSYKLAKKGEPVDNRIYGVGVIPL